MNGPSCAHVTPVWAIMGDTLRIQVESVKEIDKYWMKRVVSTPADMMSCPMSTIQQAAVHTTMSGCVLYFSWCPIICSDTVRPPTLEPTRRVCRKRALCFMVINLDFDCRMWGHNTYVCTLWRRASCCTEKFHSRATLLVSFSYTLFHESEQSCLHGALIGVRFDFVFLFRSLTFFPSC